MEYQKGNQNQVGRTTSGSLQPGRGDGDAEESDLSVSKIAYQIGNQDIKGSVNNVFNYHGAFPARLLGSRLDSRPALPVRNKHEVLDHRKRCLESLDFPLSDARFVSIKTALRETCGWLTRNDQYKDWQSDKSLPVHRGFLWIKGKPGSGKSTMMKFLGTNEKRNATDKIIITFFFNARGTALEKSTLGLYRSVLFQMLKMLPDMWHILDPIRIITDENGQGIWHVEQMKDLIAQTVQYLGDKSLVLLVDALDECSDDEVLDMVRFFEDLGESADANGVRFRTCLSSRHYPHICIKYGHQLVLEHQSEHQQDIKRFIDSELRIENSQRANTIRSKILEKASGVFLWVILVIPLLNRAYSRGRMFELERVFDRTPAKLENLFQEILLRKFAEEGGEVSQSQEEFELCIQWLLFSQRPLTVAELFFAINFGTRDGFSTRRTVDGPHEDDMVRFVLDCSRGFVEELKISGGTVQFIHESVREFFMQRATYDNGPNKDFFQVAKIHERLMNICKNYIDKTYVECSIPPLATLLDAISRNGTKLRQSTQDNSPLILYATKFCLIHSDIAQSFGLSQEVFLKRFTIEPWLSFWNVFEKYDERRYHPTSGILYIIASQCLPHLSRQFIATIDTFDVYGGRWNHPLIAAIMSTKTSGRSQTLKSFLIPNDAAFTEVPDLQSSLFPDELDLADAIERVTNLSWWILTTLGESAFSFAIKSGYRSLAKCLLATGKVDCKVRAPSSSWAHSILTKSIEMGFIDIADYLLRHDALYTANEADYLLTAFAMHGRMKPIQKLFSNDSFTTSRNDSFTVAITAACLTGQDAVVQYLIAAGADVNHELANFPTPLLSALLVGHVNIVRNILDAGADVDLRPALVAAMTDWDKQFARCVPTFHKRLYDDLHPKTKSHAEVKALVDIVTSAASNLSTSKLQQAPTQITRSWLTSDFSRPPLLVAAGRGYLDITEQFLREPDHMLNCELLKEPEHMLTCEESINAALLAAAEAGHANIVAFLIAEGQPDKTSSTFEVDNSMLKGALQSALKHHKSEVVHTLLEVDAVRFQAIAMFNEAMDRHQNIQSECSCPDFPWHRELSFPVDAECICAESLPGTDINCFEIVKSLLKGGMDPNMEELNPPKTQSSPLSRSRGQDGSSNQMTHLLLKHGASPEPWLDRREQATMQKWYMMSGLD